MIVEAVATILSLKGSRTIRTTSADFPDSYRFDEIPLTILREWTGEDISFLASRGGGYAAWRRMRIWFSIFWAALRNAWFPGGSYPSVLIFEIGLKQSRAIRQALEFIRPDIGVVSVISDPPPHAEYWDDKEAVLREKTKIVESLGVSGVAVLNGDEESARDMKNKTRAKVLTFGFEEKSDCRIIAYENHWEEGGYLSMKLSYGGSVVPMAVPGALGRGAAYAAAAASVVGLVLNINLVQISEALRNFRYRGGVGVRIIPGIKKTIILDGSGHASPASVREGLELFYEHPAERKVAVLGDMLWLGKYAVSAHEEIGRRAAKADVLITVGPRGKFIREAAERAGMPANRIYGFDIASAAGKALQNLLRKGDAVFITGSKEIGLRGVVEEVRDQRVAELL